MKVWWDHDPEAETPNYYLLYKKHLGGNGQYTDWQSIGTFDFEDNEPVRVLNAYPGNNFGDDRPNIMRVTFEFANKTQKTNTEKSAALKVWMEGGKIIYPDKPENTTQVFTNYGENIVINGSQSIMVDIMTVTELEANVTKIWDYDMVVFGTWDRAGACDEYIQTKNFPNIRLVAELNKYLDSRYSVIASHDSIGHFSGNAYGLGLLKDRFAVKVGGRPEYAKECDLDASGNPMLYNWKFGSTVVDVVKRGQVVDYPWNLSGRELHIPLTHTYGNIAMGDIWMVLRPPENHTAAGNTLFQYNLTGWPVGCDIAYLSTRNNTAMIQTGHSNCASTDDERKVWANLIYSLKQRTRKKSRFDHSCIDEDEPDPPTCSCLRYETGFLNMQCSSVDKVNMYKYRVEAYNAQNQLIGESDDREIDLTGDVARYVYHIDNNPAIEKDRLVEKQTFSLNGTIWDRYVDGQYVHIAAVDTSENVSPVVTFRVTDKCWLITFSSPFIPISNLKGRMAIWTTLAVFSATIY